MFVWLTTHLSRRAPEPAVWEMSDWWQCSNHRCPGAWSCNVWHGSPELPPNPLRSASNREDYVQSPSLGMCLLHSPPATTVFQLPFVIFYQRTSCNHSIIYEQPSYPFANTKSVHNKARFLYNTNVNLAVLIVPTLCQHHHCLGKTLKLDSVYIT